jgi:hypothetical protein
MSVVRPFLILISVCLTSVRKYVSLFARSDFVIGHTLFTQGGSKLGPELSLLPINFKVCVLTFVRLVTLRYGHRVYLCASCDPYFKIKRDFHGMQVHPSGFPFLPIYVPYKIHINKQDHSDMCLHHFMHLIWCNCRYHKTKVDPRCTK